MDATHRKSSAIVARLRRPLVTLAVFAIAAVAPFAGHGQVVASGAAGQLALSLSFDESVWSNAPGEVVDDGPFGIDGTPFGGAATANALPTCRYGIFDGGDDYVEVPDHAALDLANEVTVAAWIYLRSTPTELYTIASKDTNYEYHVDSQRRLYWWWNDSTGAARSLTATTQLGLNQWHHVAVTYRSGEQHLYIDGVQQGVAGTFTGALATNDLPFYVGTDWNFLARAFDGYIDEVRVFAAALTAAEIQTLRGATQPCAPVRFTITHNAFGIHCLAETITVHVLDAVSGTPVQNYNWPVRLDTQSAFGSFGLVAGTGSFDDATPGDGIATYTWPLGESQATFSLIYPDGPPTIDVDVFQVGRPGIRDDDAEGPLTFSPSGFVLTEAALSNPPPSVVPAFAASRTAGAEFPLHLAAFGQTPSDPVCGIIETYAGPKDLKLWSQYVDPGTGGVNVTIDGVSVAAAEGAAGNQSVTFAAGQAVVTAKYKDVGAIRILVKDDSASNADLPAGITGATANFVVRPFAFTLSDIAAGALSNPQAGSAAGPIFVAAGAPFRATVTARDAEGSPTPNYGRESIPESVRLATQIVAPAGGASPDIVAATGFGSFSGGAATGTDLAWNEVGIVQAVPHVADGNYLTAGDVVGPPSEPIGRFVPSRFDVTLNAPLFQAACTAGAFTYQGQPFHYATPPVITATAVAVNGAVTTNYTGAFFKLSNGTLTGPGYSSPAATLDTSGLPSVDPAIVDSGNGVATLTFDSGSGLRFVKGVPQAPFAAQIELAVDVVDADGVAAVANPVTFGSTTGGIPFIAGDEIRYGRVRIGTAVGSELVALPVPMRAEYFVSTGAGFVPNVADVCTDGVTLTFPPAGYTENLNPGETCVLDNGAPGSSGIGCTTAAALPRYSEPPLAGDFQLRLAAPGAGNQGGVSIVATVPDWLKFDWDAGNAGDEYPAGQATFGIFGGDRRVIYTREIY